MKLVLLLIAIQWALAGALLTPWWAGLPPRVGGTPRLTAAAALLPLLANLLVLWLIPAPPLEENYWLVALLGAMLLYGAQGLVFYLRFMPGRAQVTRTVRLSWACAGVAAQLLFVAVALWLLAGEFNDHYAPYHLPPPLTRLQLTLLLAGAALSAAVVLTGGLAGLAEAFRNEEVLVHDEVDRSGWAERDHEWAERLRLAATWLLYGLTLRGLMLAASLYMAATRSPISVEHYVTISLAPSSSYLMVRCLIGIALPWMYAWLTLFSLKNSPPGVAARQLVPAVLMILLTELLAAGLTVGNWGVAF